MLPPRDCAFASGSSRVMESLNPPARARSPCFRLLSQRLRAHPGSPGEPRPKGGKLWTVLLSLGSRTHIVCRSTSSAICWKLKPTPASAAIPMDTPWRLGSVPSLLRGVEGCWRELSSRPHSPGAWIAAPIAQTVSQGQGDSGSEAPRQRVARSRLPDATSAFPRCRRSSGVVPARDSLFVSRNSNPQTQ